MKLKAKKKKRVLDKAIKRLPKKLQGHYVIKGFVQDFKKDK